MLRIITIKQNHNLVAIKRVFEKELSLKRFIQKLFVVDQSEKYLHLS